MKLVVCFLILALLPGCKSEPRPVSSPERPSAFLFPEKGAYTGAYVDFGEGEDDVTIEAIEYFERLVGRRQAIIASSSFWGEGTFPARNLHIVASHGAVPMVFWSPWDRPYSQERPPDRFSLGEILAGKWDAYIDAWADGARAFGKPILVAWGLEMNGHWFPWSGCWYGGGKPVPEGGFEGPETFKRAYRYVVDRVRKRGAKNVLWGFHANNFSSPPEEWNSMDKYYPGDAYVDWLGLSVYGQQFAGQGWLGFHAMMDRPYEDIARLDPQKPVVLAEWGIGEFPGSGDKAQWIREAFSSFRTMYPRLKAAVFWHERWENADGSVSNLRVNSSPAALDAYREGVADPFWVDRPLGGGY